ncbi:MAG: F-type H+-transporting ATPase subunit b [Microgenomates group bacterium Gr01-1014_7]|nr:MAG: F-type H+-transporting ATPase subunit b [Microgenomates group bacterium Gr01-1014_7]
MNFLSDFGLNPVLLAAQVVNFLILLWILNKFLYKPILKILAERRKKVEDSLEHAEEAEKKLLEATEEAQNLIAKAAVEGQKIVDGATKAGLQIKDEIVQKANEAAAVVYKKNEEAVRLREERMMNEVRAAAADLVTVVIQKLTGKVITKDDQKSMIEKEVRNLS